jgi:hypothetical protein
MMSVISILSCGNYTSIGIGFLHVGSIVQSSHIHRILLSSSTPVVFVNEILEGVLCHALSFVALLVKVHL